jgi:hypothetical protein
MYNDTSGIMYQYIDVFDLDNLWPPKFPNAYLPNPFPKGWVYSYPISRTPPKHLFMKIINID